MAEDDNDDDGDVNIESFNTMESNVINNEYYKQYLSPQMHKWLQVMHQHLTV